MTYFKRDAKAEMEKILLKDSIEADMSVEEIVKHRTKKSIDKLIGQDTTLGYLLVVAGLILWGILPQAFMVWIVICLPTASYFFISGYRKKKKAHASIKDIRERWLKAIEEGGEYGRVRRVYGYQFQTTFNRSELTANIKNQTEMDAINGTSEKVPVEISTYDDKTWFYYKGDMWITNEVYDTIDAVAALSYTNKGRNDEQRPIKSVEMGKYSNEDELKDAIPTDTSETIRLQVSEDLKYLIDLEEIKKKKKVESAKNIVEGRDAPESEERSRRISQDVKDRVWKRDGGKCVKCGDNEDLEFDHIIPFSKGGANTYRNIQLLCEHCNRSKSANIG